MRYCETCKADVQGRTAIPTSRIGDAGNEPPSITPTQLGAIASSKLLRKCVLGDFLTQSLLILGSVAYLFYATDVRPRRPSPTVNVVSD